MDVSTVAELVSSLGFPMATAAVLGYLMFKIIHTNGIRMKELLEMLQQSSDKREELLMKELKECREVNSTAISIIAMYAEKLESIQKDVSEIKTNIVHLAGMNKKD
jgi:hypothetical protein